MLPGTGFVLLCWQKPSRGFLGLIGNRKAQVEVELLATPTDEAVRFLQNVLPRMGLEAVEMDVNKASSHVLINFTGEDLGILIGRRGQTLDALQYLTNVVANRNTHPYTRFILDAEGYRERRRRTLEEVADRVAKKVIRTKQSTVLDPMSPMERKIIHSRIQKYPHLTTYSEGEEPQRKVVVALKDNRSN